MNYLQKLNLTDNHDVKTCHFFNSFFYTQLMHKNDGYEYRKVARWTKKVDIFDLQKVVVPVNINNAHWAIAVMYMQDEKIEYVDKWWWQRKTRC